MNTSLGYHQRPGGNEIAIDYPTTGLTLRRPLLTLLRAEQIRRRLMSAVDLHDLPRGDWCGTAAWSR